MRLSPRQISLIGLVSVVVVLAFVLKPSADPTSAVDSHHQRIQLDPVLLSDTVRITHRFTFQNDTGRRVSLREPVRGCGCAEVALDRSNLLPGDVANFAVTLTLPKGYHGLKSVSNAVVAETGKQWRFDLAVPVIARLAVPPRIVLRPLDDIDDFGTVFTEFEVKVHSRSATTNPTREFPVEFRASNPAVRIMPLRHSRSTVKSAGLNNKDFISDDYVMRLELAASAFRRATIEWELDGATATTLIDVIAPPPVTIVPPRVIVGQQSAGPVTLQLRFARPGVSVRLLQCPNFMKPTGWTPEEAIVTTSDVSFLVDPEQAIRPQDEIAFELKQEGRTFGELKAAVVVMVKLKPQFKGTKDEASQ